MPGDSKIENSDDKAKSPALTPSPILPPRDAWEQMESGQKSKYIKKIDDAGLKREDVINLSHAEIVVELGKLGLDQHGRKLTHAKKAVLENQISLGGKNMGIRTVFYLLFAGVILFGWGFYSLVGTNLDTSVSSTSLSISAFLFSLGILLFSMALVIKGVEDKKETEWVRVAMILGGIYLFNKFIELYEPVSMFVEILNIFISIF